MQDSNPADSNSNHIHDLQARRLADAVVEMHLTSEAGTRPQRDAYRLAFVDNEFLLRRETRGIRFQLELLKPDLEQDALGVNNTIVVFGSARFREPAEAERQLHKAQASGDAAAIRRAQALVRNAHYYEKSRRFAQLVADYSLSCAKDEQLYIATGGAIDARRSAVKVSDVERALKRKVDCQIPADSAAALSAVNVGKPLSEAAPASGIVAPSTAADEANADTMPPT